MRMLNQQIDPFEIIWGWVDFGAFNAALKYEQNSVQKMWKD